MVPTLVRPVVGSDASRERRRLGLGLAARAAFTGLSIATATLLLVLMSGPNSVRLGAVERRNQAAAELLHTVLAGSSMYMMPAGKVKAVATPLKRTGMLEEEGDEHAEAGEGEAGEGEGGKGDEGGVEEEESVEGEDAILVQWGFAFVTIIIVFSVSFEMGVEWIKEAVPEELQEVVSALLEELTTLGFLGFAFFLFTVPISNGESLIETASIYSLNEKEALKELFEGLHYLVFFVSLSFILCTIGGLATFQLTGNKQWSRFEKEGQAAFDNEELMEIKPEEANAMGGLLAEWKKPESVLQAEYLRIRCRFITESTEPALDPDFEYLHYLQKRVAETFSGMIKITPYDWLATWLLLVLFFGIVQEGVTAEKMLALYWYILTMIIVMCLLLQCKLVWIKQQLIPRLPSEMQGPRRRPPKHSSPPTVVLAPVFMDQTTLGKPPFQVVDILPSFVPHSFVKLVKEYTKVRPGNKHERLFWFSAYGPEVMSHMIRLSMFWTIISLAMLLSHHMPGIVGLGEELTGFRFFGHVLFIVLAAAHLVAIATVYRCACIYLWDAQSRERLDTRTQKQRTHTHTHTHAHTHMHHTHTEPEPESKCIQNERVNIRGIVRARARARERKGERIGGRERRRERLEERERRRGRGGREKARKKEYVGVYACVRARSFCM